MPIRAEDYCDECRPRVRALLDELWDFVLRGFVQQSRLAPTPLLDVGGPDDALADAALKARQIPVALEDDPCAVCGHPEGMRDSWVCNSCGVPMHEECFWGRVATLAEWQDYLERWIEPEEGPDEPPPCLCPACRALERRYDR